VTGLGIGVFSLGITGYLFRLISYDTDSTAATLFESMNFGPLRSVPVIGDIFLSHSW
jgi:ABC-type uncharacterized transport system permease subunit